MTTGDIGTQYATGLSRQHIEQALTAAGKDLDHLTPADLGALEDFHTMGRIATGQLAELAQITGQDRVLDAGTGIGGTARYLAATYGCQVTAVDLTEEYCETASWLNRLTGLAAKITVRQADVTGLPFADAAFDVVISQHVQMNVPTRLAFTPRRTGSLSLVAASRPGTSPRQSPGPSATRCRGPTSRNAATSSRHPRCAPPSRAPGSPSATGPTSPATRSPSCRPSSPGRPALSGCTRSSPTSPSRPPTSPRGSRRPAASRPGRRARVTWIRGR